MCNDVVSRTAVEQVVKDFNKRRVDRIPNNSLILTYTIDEVLNKVLEENAELIDMIRALTPADEVAQGSSLGEPVTMVENRKLREVIHILTSGCILSKSELIEFMKLADKVLERVEKEQRA